MVIRYVKMLTVTSYQAKIRGNHKEKLLNTTMAKILKI